MLIQQTFTCFWRDEFEMASGVSGLAGVSSRGQPLGSMPWRCNSCRASCLSQLPRLTPSRSAASLSCSLSSGLMRIWKVGDKPSPLGVLSLFAVDMYVRNLIGCFLLRTYINMPSVIVTTPRKCLEPLSGRLTKPLIGVTVMAMNKHTQTRPKYQYCPHFLKFIPVSSEVSHA